MAEIRLEASLLRDFLSCPRRYHYRWVERLEPRRKDIRIETGSAAHRALAAYYAAWGHPEEERRELLLETFRQAMEEVRQAADGVLGRVPDDWRQEWEKRTRTGLKVLEEYAFVAEAEDPKFIAEVLYVEQPYAVPILDEEGREVGVQDGVMDLVVRDVWHSLWIIDHKSHYTSAFPKEDILRLDLQFGLYSLAGRYLWPEDDVRGALYNGLRMVDPDRPNTKRPILRRIPLTKFESELARLSQRLAAWARRIADGSWEDEPTPGLACRVCPYLALCSATERGDDTRWLREELYVTAPPHIAYVSGDEEE